jgi:hypothetical protein
MSSGEVDLNGRLQFAAWVEPWARREFERRWCEGRAQSSNNVILIDAGGLNAARESLLRTITLRNKHDVLAKASVLLTEFRWFGVAIDGDADYILVVFAAGYADVLQDMMVDAAASGVNAYQIVAEEDGLELRKAT